MSRKWKLCLFLIVLSILMTPVCRAQSALLVKEGMRGEQVRQVQELLIDRGYLIGEADGVCGPVTVEAIKKFQQDNGLEPDGVCGSLTYIALQAEAQTDGVVSESAENVTDIPPGGRAVYVEATAYSPMDPGMNPYTATGSLLRKGIIAVDPSFIPLGTRVFIPGYGEAIADDIGGGITGNNIDVAFDTHEDALLFGRRSLKIYIYDSNFPHQQ